MKTKVVKVSYHKAQYEVIYDDSDKTNPFRVYYLWSELTDSGLKRRRKQLEKYADLASCLFYLYDDVCRNSTITTDNGIIKETFRRR